MSKETDNERVCVTVTLPNWLNERAERENIDLSALLESALMEVLEIPRHSQVLKRGERVSREFITTGLFDRSWKAMGLGEKELIALERYLLQNPSIGTVIPEMEGARKLRFALNKGKSGGARVIYLDVLVAEELYLLFAYPKSMQSDMTAHEKKKIVELVRRSKNPRKKED